MSTDLAGVSQPAGGECSPAVALCRTCLTECPVTSTDIFDDSSLKDVLSQLIRLEIICDERLPRTICKVCHDQLQNSQSFINKARECNALLCDKIQVYSNNDILLKINSKRSVVDTADKEIQVNNGYFNFDNKSSQTKFVHSNSILSDNDDDNDGISKSDSHYPKLYDSEIKLEPEEYDDGTIESVPELTNGVPEEQELSIGNIKIEPLSVNDALKFHQGEISNDSRSIQDISLMGSLTDSNDYSQSNGCMEYDVKPNEDELLGIDSNKVHKEVVEEKNKERERSPCSLCGEIVPKKLLLKHQALHEPSIQKCILCDKRFKTRKRLKTHVIVQHSYYELLKCKICDMTFMHSKDLQEHTNIHLPPKQVYNCSLCNTGYDSDFSLTTHLYIHKEVVVLKKGDDEHMLCSACNRCFTSSLSLLTHIKSRCKDNTNSQEIADVNGIIEEEEDFDLLDKKNKIERPTRNHKIEKKPNFDENACPHCSQTFTNKYFLRIHVENHGSFIRDYCCPICLFKFKRKDHLKRHLINVHGLTNPKRK